METKIDEANEILEEYTKECSLIDQGNLFFAATEFKKAFESANAEIEHLVDENNMLHKNLKAKSQEIGRSEHRGNTVDYIYDKVKTYGDQIEALVSENKKLSETNTKLRAALEFYADANNWLEIEGTDGCREQIRNDSFKHANGYSLGGKIAREALSEPVKTGDSLQTDESKDGGK